MSKNNLFECSGDLQCEFHQLNREEMLALVDELYPIACKHCCCYQNEMMGCCDCGSPHHTTPESLKADRLRSSLNTSVQDGGEVSK